MQRRNKEPKTRSLSIITASIILAILVASSMLLFVPAEKASAQGQGGPLILMGIDAEDGGPGSHGPISVYIAVTNSLLTTATNGGNGILVIGGGKNANDNVTRFWNDVATGTGQSVTFVNGAANITAQSFAGFRVIAIASSVNQTSSGGLTQAENTALSGRASSIANHVNNGGGLFGLSQEGLTPFYGYLTGIGSFTIGPGDYDDITPTAAGTAVGITNSLDVCCWHDVYTAFPPFLNTLAFEAGTNRSAAIGSLNAFISSIQLSPLNSTQPVGATQTLTATVAENNLPVANTLVTLTVLSGPNAGLILEADTNSNGVATFAYSSATAGTDSLQASYVSGGGLARGNSADGIPIGTRTSNTVTVLWTVPASPTPTPTPTPVPSGIRINNVTRHETNSGTTNFVFDVTIPQRPGFGEPPSTVAYRTVDGSATTADNDYQSASGVIVFDYDNPTLQRVTVPVNGDIKFETNEVFLVELFNPVNAVLIDRIGTGLVYNDDLEPGFSINDVSANEGNSGNTPFTFTVTKSGNPTALTSVATVSTANGTAVAPGDYAALTNTTVSFAPNETTKTVTVQVVGEAASESNETFTVNIVGVTAGTIVDGSGTGTITNDDGTTMTRLEGDIVGSEGDRNGDGYVRANDVTKIRRIVAGLEPEPEMGQQFQAADVNRGQISGCGNGRIDAGDVTVIKQYSLGMLPSTLVCGDTVPEPARTETNEVPLGRVRAVSRTTSGPTVTMYFEIDSHGVENTIATSINWDPDVLTFASARLGDGVPEEAHLTVNSSRAGEGRIGVLLDSPDFYETGTRRMLRVTFNVAAGAAEGVYPITFTDGPVAKFVSGEGGRDITSSVAFESGTITVNRSAVGSMITGRVLTSDGRGIRNAIVILTDVAGNRRSATTSSFGAYMFENLDPNETYTLTIASRRYRFAPRVINPNGGDLTNVDFVGLE